MAERPPQARQAQADPRAWLNTWDRGVVMTEIAQPPLKHDINFYVRGLMHKLVANLRYVDKTTPVAVASFVYLDTDPTQANLLGEAIAEGLIHEIHKFGIPVIDYKTPSDISISDDGRYFFSKDVNELAAQLPIRYVFAGTLVKNVDGYIVNARVIGKHSKAVVASAQVYIPEAAARAVLENNIEVRPGRQVRLVVQ